MTKLEQHIEEIREKENSYERPGDPNYEEMNYDDGYYKGVSTILDLNLPVKFLDWILTVESTWVNSQARWVVAPDLEFFSNKELYQYWLNNIFEI